VRKYWINTMADIFPIKKIMVFWIGQAGMVYLIDAYRPLPARIMVLEKKACIHL
jgi:hypothetical protein